MKKKFLIALLFCGIAAACGIGFLSYQKEQEQAQSLANEKSNQMDLSLANQKLREWQPFYALNLVKKHLQEIYNETPYGSEWLDISLQAGAKLRDAQFLTGLFDFEKSLFLKNEEAAIVVAEQLVDQERKADFFYLKNHWQSNSDFAEKWTILDADCCAREGQSSKAITLLSSRKFKHPYEVDRLLRLAFLNLNEHPQIAWGYLSEACKLEPENPDLRLYRAHFLNAIGKEHLALEELQNSISNHSNNPLLKEELIEQHIRNKNFLTAAELLNKTLCKNSSECIWQKALFLNKVAMPIKIDQNHLIDRKMNPEIAFMLRLKDGAYFDDSQEKEYYSKAELSWMQLIHFLKQGKEEKAYRYALQESALDIYHSELRNAIIRTLAYRNPFITSEDVAPIKSSIPFFHQLENPPYTNDLRNLLASDEALSALFLAAGWNEAALQLRGRIDRAYYDLPDWYTIGITKALAQNRTIKQAIEFGKQQKPNRELAFLLGDMYLKTGNPFPAIAIFKKLASSRDEFGEKAAYLLANEYLEQGKLHLAKKTLITSNVWQTPEGRLILGRLALRLGDKEGADVIFASLANTFPEAKSYLASKAFYEKNYQLAYALTKDLFKQNPENKELKQNLTKISQAAKQRS